MTDEIKVFGLFGFPLTHSVSPAMQNAALRSLKIPGIYLPFERTVNHFLKLLRTRKKFVLDGFNLTVPYKELILPYLDRLDRSAKLANAANTIKRKGNQWIGYNTDIDGFNAGLKESKFRVRGKRAVILGAGGAARGVVAALGIGGIREIGIYNRTKQRALQLVNEFQVKFPKTQIRAIRTKNELKERLKTADLLVNATSLGLKPSDPNPLPVPFPKNRLLVYDLIYGKRKTRLLAQAKRAGNRTVSGETMLLYQGVKALEIWTARKAPIAVMKKALYDALKRI